MKSIDLTQPMEKLLRTINEECDLSVLSQTLSGERNAGKRTTVLTAIESRASSLRSYGDGADGPEYDLPGYEIKKSEPLFKTQTRLDSNNSIDVEHDHGAGAEAKQQMSKAERLFGDLERQEAKRRMNTSEELFEIHEHKSNGAIVFGWGHMMPFQKEVKGEDGKTLVHFRPSLVFLKTCPRCGRINRPEAGLMGRCSNCELDFVPYAKTEVANNPGKYPGIQLHNQA